MTRIAKLSVAALLVSSTLGLAGTVSGQTLYYDHRSTVFGDHAAGLSELVRAQGAFLVDEAAAAEKWVQVAAAEDQLLYQRAEQRYQVKQMQLELSKQRTQAYREKQDQQSAAEEAAARRLLDMAQRGMVQWPTALAQPRFAGSMSLVESLLKNWSPDDASGDAYRKALATEAGVLRTKIATDKTIAFASRVEAVRTLKHLQLLAGMSGQAGPGAVAGQQVAMR
jgi:hypothetical protein